jgi:TatD DNase family protein
VTHAAVCGTSSKDWPQVLQCLEKTSTIFPMIGIHPWFVSNGWKEQFQCLEKMVTDFPMFGVGETGLDFQEKFQNRTEQEECFFAHLKLAKKLNRPVAIHCVKAWGRMLEMLRDFPEPKKILHAYSGSAELVPELVKLNCWFSFGEGAGNPKHKKARAAVAAVPSDRLLIETDSAGEPDKLLAAAQAVAELRGISVEQIAELTFENACAVL